MSRESVGGRRPLKFKHGTVVCLRLKDFMQFSNWVEFHPGPMLNVVVGPNGSGKSSLVNGIGLALGAKTAVLGRADSISEFIRIGANEAHLEIELFNELEPGNNYKIKRVIPRIEGEAEDSDDDEPKSAKKSRPTKKDPSRWMLNGKSAKLKQVVEFVRSLNIQPDNLCQFLPQDKVHDFSRMDPKQLLVKTVEAVGDADLKKDHETLKELQKSLEKNQNELATKNGTLQAAVDRQTKLEAGVADFTRIQEIKDKMLLFKLRSEWCMVEDAKEAANEQRKIHDDLLRGINQAEERLKPKLKKLSDVVKKKSGLENQGADMKVRRKELVNQASRFTKRKEDLPDAIENLNGDYFTLVDKENNRKEELRKIEKEYEKMVEEFNNTDNQSEVKRLEQECHKIQLDMQNDNKERGNLDTQMRDLHYEKKAVEQSIARFKEDLEKIRNVQRQKVETLKTSLPNGRDAVQAMQWLQENRDQFSGKVYDPILIGIDVHDAANNAKYLENTIAARDLVAFAAENAEDANKLMRQFRDVMKLRVNVVQVDPHADPDRMRSRSGGQINMPEFKGYVKDMFSATPAIKAYLCKQFQLHNIPVFTAKADEKLGNLVEDFHVFFTGDMRHSVVQSQYSMASSTTSNAIRSRNWLQISLDKDRIHYLQTKLQEAESQHEQLTEKREELSKNHRRLELEIEAKKKQMKEYKTMIEKKKVLKGRLEVKKAQIENFKRDSKPVDLANARKGLEAKKEKLIAEDVKLSKELVQNLAEATEVRQKIMMLKAAVEVYGENETRIRNDIHEDKEEISTQKGQLGEQEEILRECKDILARQLETAQKSTARDYKGTKPPKDIVGKWVQNDMTRYGAEEANNKYLECESQLEYIEDIDPKILERYRDAQADVELATDALNKCTGDITSAEKRIEEICKTWSVQLNALIENISERFSTFFEHMGYAGQVQLDTGKHEHDFSNYGIEILVKFRDKYDLQRLDPFKQSGGERSVSTALYMMAMQTMTKVPFRCVDEINQGMDERNERKVFDLLIETSVRADSAQYFLLTPKLLPDLKFERGVDIHHVHNGVNMSHGKHVDMSHFRKVAAQRRMNRTMQN